MCKTVEKRVLDQGLDQGLEMRPEYCIFTNEFNTTKIGSYFKWAY